MPITIAFGAAALLLAIGGCREESPTGVIFGEQEIRAGGKKITVELALTPAQLEQGLKYRRRLPQDRGMLFVFPQPVLTRFWMKDTHIPLSIAFIDREGRIIDIQDMEADNDQAFYFPDQPFLSALEMNRGWFENNTVRVGDRVETGREGSPR